MAEVDELPLWHAPERLDVLDLANALELIRRMAWAHFIGDAFEPKHMHAIAAIAAHALCGESIDAPVDMTSQQWREMIRERHSEWIAAVDGAVEDQAYDAEATCERCGGIPCSECGECAGQLCRDCRCEQRDRDDDEREDVNDA